ncbi:MAG: squalene--hopene cyclase [Planctomycetes bacterium]|nr:squalene--hopene cyclase [Planctomycetota bacterium]
MECFITPPIDHWLRAEARDGARKLVRILTHSLTKLAGSSVHPSSPAQDAVAPPGLGSQRRGGAPQEAHAQPQSPHPAGPAPSLDRDVDRAVEGARDYLLRTQHPDGWWFEQCQADSTLTSEYIMLRYLLGIVDAEKQAKGARFLLQKQMADGGWPIYHGGPVDISATVKAYFALKLAGYSKDHPALVRAREAVLARGGLTGVNVFTKITLALFGQFDWRGVPTMPPEVVFCPDWFYFNLRDVSYWTRTVLTPLLIIFAKRPLKEVPPELGLDELLERPRGRFRWGLRKDASFWTWRNFFLNVDTLLKVYERFHVKPLRDAAVERAHRWMLERMTGTGGLGAIYPAMANSVLALRCLGYPMDHPLVAKAFKEIEELEVHEGDSMYLQPCHSPVWDTPLAMNALLDAGLPAEHPAITRGAEWLVARQCSRPGDWSHKAPGIEPGGWYFQFENEVYPDTDDTSMVLMALWQTRLPDDARRVDAMRRGLAWLLAMQSTNGGWGAFDIDNTKLLLNQIPFADHGALLDPPTVDVTGRALDILGRMGYDASFPPARRAVDFILDEQEENGAWYGRWGVNYVYGTWSAISGLRSIGEDMSAPYIQKALDWLRGCQNLDGGWGESCHSYADRRCAGMGKSTPSQTAWGLLAFLRAGVWDDPAVERGVRFLTRHQRPDGGWDEDEFTGTGFPRVFYLRYHLYAKYFPLWALGLYRGAKISSPKSQIPKRDAAALRPRNNGTTAFAE